MKKILCLLILIAILTLPLASCGGTYHGFKRSYSYEDCTGFIEEFRENGCAKFPMVVLDLDDEEMIDDLQYTAVYLLHYRDFKFFMTHKREYEAGLNYYVEFYLNDVDDYGNIVEHAIKINAYNGYDIWNKNIENSEIKLEEYCINASSTDENDSNYNYSSFFYLRIDGINAFDVEILSVQELTSEEISEISRIFIDNTVIYY